MTTKMPRSLGDQDLLLSIVITTRNRRDDLVECIESLVVACRDVTFWEMLVINDNSSDGSETVNLAEMGVTNGRIITSDVNLMMVKSRNVGARAAQGAYVLFVDDDNIVQPDMVTLLLDFAQANPGYGMIGPAMWWIDPPGPALDHQHLNFYTGKTIGGVHKSDRDFLDSEGIPNIFMIPRHVFKECGYFDESLIQTYTEPDFAFQIKRRGGYGCGILKTAYSLHRIYIKDNRTPRGLGGNFVQKGYCLLRNRSVMVRRYGCWRHKLVYVFLFSWFWPLAYSLIILPHKRFDLIKVYFRGWYDGMIYMWTGRLVNGLSPQRDGAPTEPKSVD